MNHETREQRGYRVNVEDSLDLLLGRCEGCRSRWLRGER